MAALDIQAGLPEIPATDLGFLVGMPDNQVAKRNILSVGLSTHALDTPAEEGQGIRTEEGSRPEEPQVQPEYPQAPLEHPQAQPRGPVNQVATQSRVAMQPKAWALLESVPLLEWLPRMTQTKIPLRWRRLSSYRNPGRTERRHVAPHHKSHSDLSRSPPHLHPCRLSHRSNWALAGGT